MEGEIGKMTADLSYRLSGMMVREFRGKKFLSTSKEYSQIEEIKDIGDVEDEVMRTLTRAILLSSMMHAWWEYCISTCTNSLDA